MKLHNPLRDRDRLIGNFLIIFLTLCILALLKSLVFGQELPIGGGEMPIFKIEQEDDGSIKRDPKVRTAYLKSIGLTRTPRGCQVDHVVPIHCGGLDSVNNMQLICGPALKAKEKNERDCKLFAEWAKQCLIIGK